MNAPANITLRMQDGTIKISNPGPDTTLDIQLSPLRPLIGINKAIIGHAADLSAENSQPILKPATRFTDNNDGTITDHSTGLMWSETTLNDKGIKHKAAEKLASECAIAGHSDWRLPTRAELLSLVDDTRYNPAIDTDAFRDTKSDWYWTSTPWASSFDYAWIVLFDHGYAYFDHRDYSNGFVRAVRVASSPGQSL